MSQVAALFEETGLDPFDSEELSVFLTSLETLVGESAPEPGPELAALLASGLGSVAAVVRPIRKGSNLAVAALLAATGIVSTGVAAAANDLPPVAQRIVADFSNRFLPFDFPRPGVTFEDRLGQIDPDGRTGQDAGQETGPDADDTGSAGFAAPPGGSHQRATEGDVGDSDLDDEGAGSDGDHDSDDRLASEPGGEDDDEAANPSGGGSDENEDDTDHDADDSSEHDSDGDNGGSGSGSGDGKG